LNITITTYAQTTISTVILPRINKAYDFHSRSNFHCLGMGLVMVWSLMSWSVFRDQRIQDTIDD